MSRMLSALLTSANVTVSKPVFPYAENLYTHHSLTDGNWMFAKDAKNVGKTETWQKELGSARWMTGQMTVGGDSVKAGCSWKRFLEKDYKGIGWYRISFALSAKETANGKVQVTLRNLVGADETWVNGTRVGSYAKSGADRGYWIPRKCLKIGENLLVVRVEDESGAGGLCGAVDIHVGNGLPRLWETPYPQGVARDYDYPCDMIRMY